MRKINLYIGIIILLLGISGNINAQDKMLTKKQEKIITISAFAAKGELDKLKIELNAGLDAELTVNEIKEVLVHLYAYSGFPRSIRGLQTLMSVLDQRKANAINDNWGREASPITDTRDKYERGKKILAELSGVTIQGRPQTGYAAFSPEIETFLKEHLFADIFERDVLTYAQREMVTVSVIAALGGLEPMLSSHMNLSLNVGITPEQLNQLINIIEINVGKKEADAAGTVLKEVLQSKGLNSDFNTSKMGNGIRIEKISFLNRFHNNVVGNLYFPLNYDANKKYAAIIIGHPFGGVKEQTSGLHAQKMAELGYITLAFDASHYGESGGYPRYIESPETRVEDFSAAVDFLSNHKNVKTEAIGVIGICGGGGYSVSAAQIDHRIKAVATISMYDMGRARRQGLGDVITYDQRMKTLDEIGEQRTREFKGESRKDIAAIPTVLSENDTENTKEFFDYYRTPRGGHPNSTTSYSYTSLAPMMNFFPFIQIETISPRPLLFIVGERAVSAYFSEDAYSKAAEPKELYIVPGASHVDLYDRPEYTAVSLSKLDSFFKQYLK
ncbi:carboxymuconolactone decarboxylase family protein [Dysgonomonas sp. Marseille-P4677]|uniref:carboxymuconolactone decarboxylase family protein n=1 Tax=Dysgonomonas sp. Marseille-P4677 TaxID=2364790 RepID=UPI0019112D99|nr:carboxymuconolactone decarboxylase family protein [Dysgonomonas sp. Marseille-P4677]MBK5722181.1 carboxymuconolactone decarboxylase family protein [Dysgonomonas sp. Marseille-P4677]